MGITRCCGGISRAGFWVSTFCPLPGRTDGRHIPALACALAHFGSGNSARSSVRKARHSDLDMQPQRSQCRLKLGQARLMAKIEQAPHLPGVDAHGLRQLGLRHGAFTHRVMNGNLDGRTRRHGHQALASLGLRRRAGETMP